MADKKVTQLTELLAPQGEDLILVVDDPTGTPVSKRMTLQTLFGNVQANTTISGSITVSGNTTFTDANYGPRITAKNIVVGGPMVVTSNNATTQFGEAGWAGALFWDENYLYVAVSDTNIKRIALSNWDS